ncbi:MAG: mannosyltransferase [Vezdaea aestivalis]|nr:MAG: mannosyltransferase [Vezdaea aestivalis]
MDKSSIRPSSASSGRSKSGPHSEYYVKPIIAFYIFFVSNLISALYAPIQDCDEVYNYWEPLHYLRHGFGLQTWEYSPEYAIRSWCYISLHALIGKIGMILLPLRSKEAEFFLIRGALGFGCAICQARFFTIISRTLNQRIGVFFIGISVASPGMFHASTALLPSSFAMYMAMLGMSSFMDWRGGLRTNNGIMFFGAGALLGWPFAAALVFPFLLEELVLANLSKQVADTLHRFLDGLTRASIIGLFQFAVDSYFYRGMQVVPFNIVWYNIFSVGPNIFGIEPWHFYFKNLALNFNLWFILALASFPLISLQLYWQVKTASMQNTMRSIVFVAPFYMWLAIFTLQPHKEERFMFPAYPALVLNAAMSLNIILTYFGSTDPRSLVSKIPAKLKLIVVVLTIMGAVDLGILRMLGMTTAYSAPLKIYQPLMDPSIAGAGDVLCLGKEWYRFPSSFFLPDKLRAHFIRSKFHGLLPGQFSEVKEGFGFWPGTYLLPVGMNNENIEDEGKYVRPISLTLSYS